jgi:hypothetical protein
VPGLTRRQVLAAAQLRLDVVRLVPGALREGAVLQRCAPCCKTGLRCCTSIPRRRTALTGDTHEPPRLRRPWQVRFNTVCTDPKCPLIAAAGHDT